MQVIIRKDAMSAAQFTARLIADQVQTKPSSVLGLATGTTMERVYAELARLHRENGLDFSLTRTFNLDEYVGLAPDNPHSYRHYMNTHLFGQVNIDVRNTHLPHGMADDFRLECERYEALIKECGGIDLQLLGIGKSGHIGFNEPLSSLMSRTREKALTPQTIAQNQPLFPSPAEMPTRGITMGVGTILEADAIVLLATGQSKAAVLAKAVEGPVTSMISASALQLHPNCLIVTDEEAAAELTQKDYYRWIFKSEPEWQKYQNET
jgi:glucosamine-6-phosphate deaminase